ncbi:MAG: glycogen synthase [Gemmatimonadales bacterium]|nr:glycogen synthase [Gemmatimonadales bacterium]
MSTPGRVLITTDTLGGVWTYAIDLARALRDEGVEVALAAMGGPASAEQRADGRDAASLGFFEGDYRLPWMAEPWEEVAAAGCWLLELSSKISPDVVHFNEPVHAALAWERPTVAVGHSCVLSWWQAVLNEAAPASWNRYREAMIRGLLAADVVVAPSASMLQELGRYYGVKQGRVIPNGRDSSQLSPGLKQPLVFAAGRVWDRGKNLLALEEVASRLPWPVYIAGETRDPEGRQGSAATRVCLLGRLSQGQVAEWLAVSSIYAFPARYEPFGLSVVEAALAGCALVLSDLPTLRELWPGSAVFVPLDEPDALRQAIQGLIEDPHLRHTLAMRARRRALTLTPRRMARAYCQAYSDAIAHAALIPREYPCAS